MTVDDIIRMPKGMHLEEYDKLLKEKERLEKKLRKASDMVFDLEDSLEVLSDEFGSERYRNYVESRDKYKNEVESLKMQLASINTILCRNN